MAAVSATLLDDKELASIEAPWRAADFLGAAQIYLGGNALLEEPMSPGHIKPRLLGHWGPSGINFISTYALATASGAAFDNPDLIVARIVGDGEAETGPTTASWHSNKSLNTATDGAVLPFLHVNDYKISGRTIPGYISREELAAVFTGYGYMPLFVESRINRPDDHVGAHHEMAQALDEACTVIEELQSTARRGGPIDKPRWPVIVMRSPKGWAGVREVNGKPVDSPGVASSH